jgi:FG-GAP repeat
MFGHKILHASDYTALSEFGTSLAIDNTNLVVGAPAAKTNGQTTGAAYVFLNTDLNGYTWMHAQKLSPISGVIGSSFGESVAINGNKLLVGSPHYDYVLNSIGAIWNFQYNGNTWGYTSYNTIHQEYLIMGYEIVTDNIYDIYNMPGWSDFHGRVAVRTSTDIKYLYHEDPDLERTFGHAIDMHNGQIVITSKNNTLLNRNGTVHFGRLD